MEVLLNLKNDIFKYNIGESGEWRKFHFSCDFLKLYRIEVKAGAALSQTTDFDILLHYI